MSIRHKTAACCFQIGLILLISPFVPCVYSAQSDNERCEKQPDPPCPPGTGGAQGPSYVNYFRGNFFHTEELYNFPSPGLRNEFALNYRNKNGWHRLFGHGWHSPLDIRINDEAEPYCPGAYVVLTDGKGTQLLFTDFDLDGNYTHPEGFFLTLNRNMDGTYDLTRIDGTKCHFGKDGLLETITDANGNRVTYRYEIINVTEPEARWAYTVDFENNPHMDWGAEPRQGSDPAGCCLANVRRQGTAVSVTSDPGEVINGSYSLKILVSPLDYTYAFMSSAKLVQPNTKYRISFKYKCVKDFGQGWMNVDVWTSHFTELEMHALQPEAGEAGEFSFYYTTDHIPSYRLMFEFEDVTEPGAIIIDDVKIEPLQIVEPPTKKVPVEITDTAGRKTYLEYGPNGKVRKVIDPGGREYEFGYDDYHNLVSITDPIGQLSSFTYDEAHNLISKTDANGNSFQITYYKGTDSVDSWINTDGTRHSLFRVWADDHAEYGLVTDVDQRGNAARNVIRQAQSATYAETLVRTEDALGGIRDLEWSWDRRLTRNQFTDPVTGEAILTEHTYNEWGQHTSTKDSLGNENGAVYHPVFHDRVTREQDAAGNITEYEYDGQGNRTLVLDTQGNETSYTYDSRGLLQSITDAEGNMTSHTYDNAGNRIKTVDALGHTTSRTYDNRGNPLSETDARGNTRIYAYDALDRLLTESDAIGSTNTYAYDALGNRTSMTDGRGNTTYYEYDRKNRLIKETNAQGHVTLYHYDGNGNLISVIDPAGNVNQYEYDANNRRTAETDPEGNRTSYVLDGRGNRLIRTDQEGKMTRYAYDSENRLSRVEDAEGHSTSYTYDAKGRRIAVSDIRGITRTVYDALDRVVRIIDAQGRETGFTYDSRGNRTSISDALGRTTFYTYDALNRLTSTTDPKGNTTSNKYDNVGNLIRVINALGQVTEYQYDANNRVTAVIDSLGNRTCYAFDANGNRVSMTDANGNTTRYEFDPLNQLIRVMDAESNTVSYAYDQRGNLVSITDGNGHTTRLEYDQDNRLVKRIDPLGEETRYAYDRAGNLAAKTDPNGNTFPFVYDAVGNLASKTYPDNKVYTWTYDAWGNMLTKSINGILLEQNVYDSRNRLICRTITGKGSISYTYDALGNILTFTDQESGIIRYAYDALNHVLLITDADDKTTAYVYDALGRRTKRTYPNGCISTYGYDTGGQLVTVSNLDPKKDIISSYSYTYDATGNRTRLEEPDRITAYSYDSKSQLVGAEVSSRKGKGKGGQERLYDVHYTYDAAGNRIAMEVDTDHGQSLPFRQYASTHDKQPRLKHPLRVEYSYNNADQLISETAYRTDKHNKRHYEIVYAYDANGNMTAKSVTKRFGEHSDRSDRCDACDEDDDCHNGSFSTSYQHDYQNLLSRIIYPDGEINTFQNCRCGTFRLQKVDSQGLRNYLYDKENDSPIFETDAKYNSVIKYVKGPRIDELICKKYLTDDGKWKTVYYLYDGLGSVRQLVDEEGRVVAEYDYLPFGEIIEAHGGQAKKNSFAFQGREYDRDSGLYYYRARYMDPKQGRFTTVDPLISQAQASGNGRSMQYFTDGGCSVCGGGTRTVLPVSTVDYTPAYGHPYVYVENNPVNYTDPEGEACTTWTIKVGGREKRDCKKLSSVSLRGLAHAQYDFEKGISVCVCHCEKIEILRKKCEYRQNYRTYIECEECGIKTSITLDYYETSFDIELERGKLLDQSSFYGNAANETICNWSCWAGCLSKN